MVHDAGNVLLLLAVLLATAVGELKASFEGRPDAANWRTDGTIYAKNCQGTRGSALFFFTGGTLSSRALKLAAGPAHRYRVLGARWNLGKSGVSCNLADAPKHGQSDPPQNTVTPPGVRAGLQ